MAGSLRLIALALLLAVSRAQWASFSATHYAVLQSSSVVPAPSTASLNTGIVLIRAVNISLDSTIDFAIVTNCTNVTNVAAYFFESATSTGQLLMANISRPTQGYANYPTFYTGTLDIDTLAAQLPNNIPLVSATQLYIEIHTAGAGGVELRGNIVNINGKQTHTAVMTASQTTPPLSNPDGGIALVKIANSNFAWSAVWSPRDLINNGINFWAPADVGTAAGQQSLAVTTLNASTANSGAVNSLSSDGSQRFSKPNFDNSKTYIQVQTVTDPAASTGRIRGQFNPITPVSDAAFTLPPTTNPNTGSAATLAASLALIVAFAIVLA